jgi:hypothetical protein
MTIKLFPGGPLYVPKLSQALAGPPNYSTGGNILIDAADEAAAYIFKNPQAGNISKLAFRTGAVTTGATVTVSLESVSTASQPSFPNGLYATNTSATQAITTGNANTWFEVTLTAAAASVPKNELLAIKIANPTVSFGNMAFAMYADSGGFGCDFPYSALYTGSWAGHTSNAPVMAIGYDDGSWAVPDDCFAFQAINNTSFNSGSTPDVRGARLKFEADTRTTGFYALVDSDNAYDVKLVTEAYHQANATGILASVSIAANTRKQTGGSLQFHDWDTPVTLDADTYYRLIYEPTTGSSIQVYDATLGNSGVFTYGRGEFFHMTTAKDPTGDASWTNYDNATDGYRVPWIGLKIDGVDIPAGGGSTSSESLHAIEAGIAA